MDYRVWLHHMNKHGYAEAKGKWIHDITTVITKYKLTQYDTCHMVYVDPNAPIWGYDTSLIK